MLLARHYHADIWLYRAQDGLWLVVMVN